jgi:hypothetical protein
MMNRRLFLICSSAIAGLMLCLTLPISAQLRVGAGRVDITPDPTMLPEPFTSIHDPIFTRAIFIENGSTSALLVNVDLGKISQGLYDKVAQDISTRYGIPMDNIIISTTHVHSSVGELGKEPFGPPSSGGAAFKPLPGMQAFIDRVSRGMLEAVKQAKDSLQPAEMGFGEGKLYLNVNRDAIDPKTRLWAQEPNLEFPSDKTLAVLEFRKPNGGAPIAIYMNYAMHAVTMFLRSEISGDFPETASRYIEGVYDDKVVAELSQGAEGDQNPLYLRAINALGETRIQAEMDHSKPDDAGGSEHGAALIRLFDSGATHPMPTLDPKLATQSWQVVQAMGTMMGEETLRVMDGISHFSGSAVIHGSSSVVTCPGRKRLDHNREGVAGTYEDGPPAKVRVGALRIGTVALARTDSEIYNKIGQEIKAGSPFRNTIVVALADGGGRYIPTDDAFGRNTFQVLGAAFKPGCFEMGIVNNVDEMLYTEFESTPQR